MAIPRLHMMTTPTQTIKLVDGVLKFDSRPGVRLKPQTAPTSATSGMLLFNSSTNDLQYYNGTAWVSINLNNEVDKLADKHNASHLGTGTPRPTPNEHRYLNATSEPNWKLWSTDQFIDFDTASTIPSALTLTGTVIIQQGANMSNQKVTRVRDPQGPQDLTNKQYADVQVSELRDLVNAKTKTMRDQINAKHTELQNLWNSRQITVPTTHSDYARQKALYDQMVNTTKRLLGNGSI